MINKALVKKRFSKSLKTYEENAIIQKIMAKKLIKLLDSKEYNSIFEIGCATGILTKEIKKNLTFKEYSANDIVEKSQEYINKIIYPNTFLAGDIEEIKLNKKYNLILSNASLQWCNDIEKVLEKLINSLEEKGTLAISIFGDNNLKEIKDVFHIENNTYSSAKLRKSLEKYNLIKFEEEEFKIEFENPIMILKHLKLTGVNAIKEFALTKKKLKEFEEEYIRKYQNNGKVLLTYNPVYIKITK